MKNEGHVTCKVYFFSKKKKKGKQKRFWGKKKEECCDIMCKIFPGSLWIGLPLVFCIKFIDTTQSSLLKSGS